MRKALITGGRGLLGTALTRALTGRYLLFPVDLGHFDVTEERSVRDYVDRIRPDVVLHCAGFTDVDGAEERPDAAEAANARGTLHVADAAARAGARLVYFSSDYVFDGEKGRPYVEDDPTSPVNVYGRTKLEGEEHVRRCVPQHLVVRTQGLYGPMGRSFVGAILDADRAGRQIRVVGDLTTGTTYAADLAQAVARMLETDHAGTFHVANRDPVTWYDFARAVLDGIGRRDVPIARITVEETGRRARRPRWSVLDPTRFERTFGMRMRPWRAALRAYLATLHEAGR